MIRASENKTAMGTGYSGLVGIGAGTLPPHASGVRLRMSVLPLPLVNIALLHARRDQGGDEILAWIVGVNVAVGV